MPLLGQESPAYPVVLHFPEVLVDLEDQPVLVNQRDLVVRLDLLALLGLNYQPDQTVLLVL